jgi:hypothetical protein
MPRATTRCAATSCSPTWLTAARPRCAARWTGRRCSMAGSTRRSAGWSPTASRPRPSTPRPGWPNASAASATRCRRCAGWWPRRPTATRARPRLAAAGARTERSADPAHRAYQQQAAPSYNCGFAARLHNATSAAQRQTARERIKGWEDDLRALALPAPACRQPLIRAPAACNGTVTRRGSARPRKVGHRGLEHRRHVWRRRRG